MNRFRCYKRIDEEIFLNALFRRDFLFTIFSENFQLADHNGANVFI